MGEEEEEVDGSLGKTKEWRAAALVISIKTFARGL
jgi:hypothetical protein